MLSKETVQVKGWSYAATPIAMNSKLTIHISIRWKLSNNKHVFRDLCMLEVM